MSGSQRLDAAIVQVASPPGETRDARVERICGQIAGLPRVDLVVLPELWATGYFNFDGYSLDAEPLNGDLLTKIGQVARRRRTWVSAGSFVERRGGALHNTTVLFDAQGEVAHTYRKIHLFGHDSQEGRLLTPGDVIGATDTPWGRMATTTCYDLRFPELYRGAVDEGAELVLVTSAWPKVRSDHWDVLTRARAVENQMFVLAVNGVGRTHAGSTLAGRSRLIDPAGVVEAEASDRDEAVLLVEIDLARVGAVRSAFPVLADRPAVSTAGLAR